MTGNRRAGQQRERVLGLLREATQPAGVQHIADSLGIHITTARFHLRTLEEQGHIVRRSGGAGQRAGRPSLAYAVAPRLDYADVVSLFAVHLGGTAAERESRAALVGADLAHRVNVARHRASLSAVDLVVETLGELGFTVKFTLMSFGSVTVQICSCPLAEIATTAPEVVRGIQRGLIQEVLDVNADAVGGQFEVTVSPDAGHGDCTVSLTLDPQVKGR
ncbi:helix-turn-helix transcriptional regulator [Mycobacteroides chelonae]|jgi:predicted ArsR family transcriptional regulator|uniref:helix-turn-helix transcriptional regulator n=1 Tax=Mycobacteroides chelonae TaxID=1774 RepID=UPI00099246AE|nr:helix-turn-helix domain-containing protein [Mycobacteroides chelonae]MBF9328794.1 helix-turn-helix domain-containing protein [Mycobacteroides chelonae]MBF9423427.1 helix-turn-helix domain-containing protein [Mycobacteroides chelonae]MBF9434478.1 helix-turn-helix domain-containing protein [Mycobacteroides chelonae]MBV6362542.1 helix-turn-helix domain-containing protein [Mycobacteroides chelonae]MEC4836053.1 helix-turn-helix domain-containing protein [Mycobacteroides chelonae]